MNQERLMTVLQAPRISEKATFVADKNKQFVFVITPDATKDEVKQAVEFMFKVEVASVQVCNIKGKIKQFKRKNGQRPGMKKAYVKLKPGFDIDFMNTQ